MRTILVITLAIFSIIYMNTVHAQVVSVPNKNIPLITTSAKITNKDFINLQKQINYNKQSMKSVNTKLIATKKYLFSANKQIVDMRAQLYAIEKCANSNKFYNKKTNKCVTGSAFKFSSSTQTECAEGSVITYKDGELICELPVNGCNCPYTAVAENASWPATTTCGLVVDRKYKTANIAYPKKGVCTLSGWAIFTP